MVRRRKINYNIALIEKILNDLTLLTRVSFSFLDNQKKCVFSTSPTTDFCSCLKQEKPIIKKSCALADEKLLEKCEKSLCLESSQCHAKLYDAAMALVKQKVICGYIIFGRVRSKDSPPNPFFQDENGNLGAKTLCRFNYLLGRLVDECVVVSFESYSDFLLCHGFASFKNCCTFAVRNYADICWGPRKF